MLGALMRERNWYVHFEQYTLTTNLIFLRDAVTKTNTVSDLIQTLDAQGVTSHLTFLLSSFVSPSADHATPTIDEKGVAKKKGKSEVQVEMGPVSAAGQVTTTVILLAFKLKLFSAKVGHRRCMFCIEQMSYVVASCPSISTCDVDSRYKILFSAVFK